MWPLMQLELHVTHSCNLTCESCAHYSNQGHKGLLDLAQADHWLSQWSGRLRPEHFNLVGGEPSIHPRLVDFVYLARRHWPASKLRVITNGFFLHRHPDLPRSLRETDTLLAVSMHHASPEYGARFQPIAELVSRWQKDEGVRAEIWDAKGRWTRRYLGFGAALQPYSHGQPQQSWEICPAKHCMQLHEGKLWKCPALAYLGMQNERYGLRPEWSPYLRYEPLRPGCSDDDLRDFLGRRAEACCGMCPANPQPFELPSPLLPIGTSRAA